MAKGIMEPRRLQHLVIIITPIMLPAGILYHYVFGSSYKTFKDLIKGFFEHACGFKFKNPPELD